MNAIKHLLVILFFLLPVVLPAQENSVTDSLKAVINNPTTHDTSKINTIFKLANHYYLHNPDTTIKMIETAKEISERLNFDRGMAGSYGWLGYLLESKGDVTSALDYLSKGLVIEERIGDQKAIASSLNNIAFIYNSQGEVEEAIVYFERSVTIKEQIGNDFGLAYSLNNIGFIYMEQGDFSKSKKYFQRSLKLREKIGDKKGMAESYSNFGAIYEAQDDLGQALEHYFKSLPIFEETNDKEGRAYTYNNIAGIYLKMNNTDKAEPYARQSLTIAKELGFPKDIESAASVLSKIVELQGSYKEALVLHKLTFQMRDSVLNEKNAKATIKQQLQYDYEKQKVIDDVENEKQVALEHKEAEKQKLLAYGASAGLALVIVFLIFVFNRLNITRKQKRVIEIQHTEIQDSINYAKNIQSATLPLAEKINEDFEESFILYKPRDVVSGDFYWHHNYGDAIAISVADCTGHGVPGGFMSMMGSELLNQVISDPKIQDPSAALTIIDKRIKENLNKTGANQQRHDGMDLILCFFWPEKNIVQYSGANNNLIRIREGKLETFNSARYGVGGLHTSHDDYPLHEIVLNKGDQFYLATDGYYDQFGGPLGKKFMSKRFKELLVSINEQSMKDQKDVLNQRLEDWMNEGDSDQIDDICVIGLKIK